MNMATFAPSLKKRRPNWTDGEHELLVELVCDKLDKLRARFTTTVTGESKQKLWSDITDRINASSETKRTCQEIKKKWQDLQSLVKKKSAEEAKKRRTTGGGPPPPSTLKRWETVIRDTLPVAAITGLQGGVDTAEATIYSQVSLNEVGDVELPLPVVSETLIQVVPELPIRDTAEPEPTTTEPEQDVDPMPRNAKKQKKNRAENETLSFEDNLLQIEKNKERYREEKLKILAQQTTILAEIRDHLMGGAFLNFQT